MYERFFYRSFILFLGLFLLAFAVVLSIHSDLGTAPISSIPYTFSYFIPLSVGTLTVLLHGLFIILQMILLKNEFQWIQWSQILVGLVFGIIIDTMLWFTTDWQISSYPFQIILSLISCILTAVGVCFMFKAQLFYLAGEGLYQACAHRFKLDVGTCKTIGDCVLVTIAIITSFLVLNKLVGVREGTILMALLVGTLVRVLKPYFSFLDYK